MPTVIPASQFFGGQPTQPNNPQSPVTKPGTVSAQDFFGGNIQRQGTQVTQQPTASNPVDFGINTLSNIPKSLGGVLGGIGSAAINVFNPDMSKNTVANLLGTAAGGVQELAGGALGTGQEQKFDVAKNFFVQRYGGLDKVLNTIQNDPVSFALDAATLLSGVGAGVSAAGKMSDLADIARLAKVGGAIPMGEAGANLADLGKLGGTASKIGAGLTKAGRFIDPTLLAEKALSPLAGKISNKLGIASTDVANSAFSQTPGEIARGRAIGDFQVENGKVGTVAQMEARNQAEIDNLNKVIDNKIAVRDFKFNGEDVVNQAKQIFLKDHPGMFSDAQVEKIFNNLPIAGLREGEVAGEFGNTLRKSLDATLPKGTFVNADPVLAVANQAKEAVVNALRDTIQKGTGTSHEFKQLSQYIQSGGTQYGRQLKGLQRTKKLSLTREGVGIIAGNTIGGIPGAVATVALEKVLHAPGTKLLLAKALKKTANLSSAVAKSKANQIITSGITSKALFQAGRLNP